VLCHKGATVADPAAVRSVSDCIGKRLTVAADVEGEAGRASAQSPTFARCRGPNAATSVHVTNVASASASCTAYSTGAVLALPSGVGAQELLAIPLRDRRNRTVAVVGIAANRAKEDDACHLGGDVLKAIESFIHGDAVRNWLDRLQRRALVGAVAHQALDWLEITTGKSNCYVALFSPELADSNATDKLHVVASTDRQKWLVGRSWAPTEGGVVHPFLSGVGASLVSHLAPLATATPAPKIFNDAVKSIDDDKAELLMAAITLRHSGDANDADAPVYGALVLDTLDTSGARATGTPAFKEADKELVKTTAYLLAECMTELATGQPDAEARAMAVESVVDRSHLLFLSKVWTKVTKDLLSISANDLNEVKRYNNPPPVIHTVCAATFITIGTKPSTVATWDGTRKKVDQATIKKLYSFDPTSKKVKKAFSLRSRKMTKGMTADDVFTKGSYPASCFFAWTFVVNLIRKVADQLRKRAAAGTLGIAALDADDLSSTATGVAGESGADNDDDVAGGDEEQQEDEQAAEAGE
jgi:hypothetical protein